MSSSEQKGDYVYADVELEGIGTVHTWAAWVVASNGAVYLGNAQMAPIGPMVGPRDPETGIRPQLRRQFVEADEQTIRKALEEKLMELFK
jgi:hypothetical protein